mmetsp:Transcript_5988/g.21902  ORF Transcript_5988/g.21902 Transcript_5988/m.21902 type:complete len:278 (-) Transcript_5988:3164-3997(-)
MRKEIPRNLQEQAMSERYLKRGVIMLNQRAINMKTLGGWDTNFWTITSKIVRRAVEWKRIAAEACQLDVVDSPPSAGLLGVVVATSVCGSTSVYGFDSMSWPYHYFTQGDSLEWNKQDAHVLSKWENLERLRYPCLTQHGGRVKAMLRQLASGERVEGASAHDWLVEVLRGRVIHVKILSLSVGWVGCGQDQMATIRELNRTNAIELRIGGWGLQDSSLRIHNASLACAPEKYKEQAKASRIEIPPMYPGSGPYESYWPQLRKYFFPRLPTCVVRRV